MKQFYYLVLCSVFTLSLSAQPITSEIEDRLEARRVAYITQELDLTVEEAQTFWPLYNKYRDSRKALREQYGMKKEDKAQQKLEDIFAHDEKALQLKKDFANQILGILGEQRTMHLLTSERRFKERMIRGIQGRSERHGKRGGFRPYERKENNGN